MITIDRDICILDTETLGLDRDAPIWDFAAVRIDPAGTVVAREEFLILHEPGDWVDQLPEQFRADYRARYWAEFAARPSEAALHIAGITDGAVVAGSNPSFDTERLAILLHGNGFEPGWHYHPLDIPSMALGALAHSVAASSFYDPDSDGPIDAPWKSDQLSRRIGVNPGDYARHTAAGDVAWCVAQWQAMTGQQVTL